jgi:hypothetical protein
MHVPVPAFKLGVFLLHELIVELEGQIIVKFLRNAFIAIDFVMYGIKFPYLDICHYNGFYDPKVST